VVASHKGAVGASGAKTIWCPHSQIPGYESTPRRYKNLQEYTRTTVVDGYNGAEFSLVEGEEVPSGMGLNDLAGLTGVFQVTVNLVRNCGLIIPMRRPYPVSLQSFVRPVTKYTANVAGQERSWHRDLAIPLLKRDVLYSWDNVRGKCVICTKCSLVLIDGKNKVLRPCQNHEIVLVVEPLKSFKTDVMLYDHNSLGYTIFEGNKGYSINTGRQTFFVRMPRPLLHDLMQISVPFLADLITS